MVDLPDDEGPATIMPPGTLHFNSFSLMLSIFRGLSSEFFAINTDPEIELSISMFHFHILLLLTAAASASRLVCNYERRLVIHQQGVRVDIFAPHVLAVS